jgi:shikimate dehydrogenase
LHGHWLRRHGIEGSYVPLHVRPGDLDATLDLLPRLGFAGINVTLPHKEAAFAAATTATDRARTIGAANTLIFRDGAIHADNTDGYGFLANLRQEAPGRDTTAPAFVLGAGGAARGIVAALLEEGASHVTLTNRTAARADALRREMGDRVRTVPWDDAPSALSEHGLLVNTTSLGMTGQGALDLDLGTLDRDATVTDIVYAPLETPLLAAARARGNPVVDGLGMLLHQAVPGFAAWFGTEPVVDDALRAAVLA